MTRNDLDTVYAALRDGEAKDADFAAMKRIEREVERLRAAIQEHRDAADWDPDSVDRKLWAVLEEKP